MLSHIEAIIRATCQQDGSIPASRINEAIAVLRGEAATARTDTPAKLEPVLKRQEVARLLGITTKGVDYHAKHGGSSASSWAVALAAFRPKASVGS